MASATQGEFLWQADAVFDARQSDVATAAERYYKRHYERGNYFYGWEIMLLSIDRYAEFVCDALVATLQPPRG